MLDHRHILVKATGLARPPREAAAVSDWLIRLVEAVEMTVLLGPYSIRCETEGNEGCTGAIVIETSHASIHVWDECEVPHLEMDLFSCMHFDSATVLDLIREFSPARIHHMVVDRNSGLRVIEEGDTGP